MNPHRQRRGERPGTGASRQRSRPTVGRGFDLVQLAVATFLIALLAAVAYAALVGPMDDTRHRYVEDLLVSVDLEARSMARQAGVADPTPYLHDAVTVVPVPEDEATLGDDDRDRFRIRVDVDAAGVGQVTVVRFGRCARLHVDPDGGLGTVVRCRADAPDTP